jgi:cyclase
MLSKRIIACLDVRSGQVVKGVNFEGLRSAGDPAELGRRYNAEGIDELVILDITATLEARRALADTIARVARARFIQLAVRGGIRTADHAAAAVEAGADKVSLNTAALADPNLITRIADRYGSQAVVVAIDAKRESPGSERFAVYARSGQAAANRDAVEWAREAESRGAGTLDDFLEVFTTGRADAALAASIFHYSETSVRTLKQYLHGRGIPVRL